MRANVWRSGLESKIVDEYKNNGGQLSDKQLSNLLVKYGEIPNAEKYQEDIYESVRKHGKTFLPHITENYSGVWGKSKGAAESLHYALDTGLGAGSAMLQAMNLPVALALKKLAVVANAPFDVGDLVSYSTSGDYRGMMRKMAGTALSYLPILGSGAKAWSRKSRIATDALLRNVKQDLAYNHVSIPEQHLGRVVDPEKLVGVNKAT